MLYWPHPWEVPGRRFSSLIRNAKPVCRLCVCITNGNYVVLPCMAVKISGFCSKIMYYANCLHQVKPNGLAILLYNGSKFKVL